MKYKRREYLQDPIIRGGIAREQQSGLRFCSCCDAFLPLAEFKAGPTRIFMCLKHARAYALHKVLGTTPKKAFNTLRCRVKNDMEAFGQTKMCISHKEFMSKLSEEQTLNFSDYALVPRRPSNPITTLNSVIVTTEQRKFLVTLFKRTKNADEYEKALLYFISPSTRRQMDASNETESLSTLNVTEIKPS